MPKFSKGANEDEPVTGSKPVVPSVAACGQVLVELSGGWVVQGALQLLPLVELQPHETIPLPCFSMSPYLARTCIDSLLLLIAQG